MSLIKKAIRAKLFGFTMIEFMIALAVNTILLAALLYAFAATIRNTNLVIASDTLSQQLQNAMNIMANDIRRAGYWANASTDIAGTTNNNPFMATATNVSVGTSCILFAYDHNKTGVLPAISASGDDDRYGYRLNGGILQTRPPGAAFSCTASATAWENMTNSNIMTITALTFTLTTVTVPVGATTKYILLRSVNISITGQLVSNASVTKTLTQHVRIRNDYYNY